MSHFGASTLLVTQSFKNLSCKRINHPTQGVQRQELHRSRLRPRSKVRRHPSQDFRNLPKTSVISRSNGEEASCSQEQRYFVYFLASFGLIFMLRTHSTPAQKPQRHGYSVSQTRQRLTLCLQPLQFHEEVPRRCLHLGLPGASPLSSLVNLWLQKLTS